MKQSIFCFRHGNISLTNSDDKHMFSKSVGMSTKSYFFLNLSSLSYLIFRNIIKVFVVQKKDTDVSKEFTARQIVSRYPKDKL